MSELTLTTVADRAGVSPATVRRWVKSGLVPAYEGQWTPAAAAHVRVLARMRARGHTLQQVREANKTGQLATSYLENLLSPGEAHLTAADAAEATGLKLDLVERIIAAIDFGSAITEQDIEVLRQVAALLDVGLPEPALLQLANVYAQSLAQIADASVRVIHMYVHEPMMRDGMPALKIAETMEELAGELLPLTTPLMSYLHSRYLVRFVEDDMIGHMNGELSGTTSNVGRIHVALAFADLAGYTQLTEQHGQNAALRAVESFVQAVGRTLPTGARIVKRLGDEVMLIAPDAVALTEWAVDFQVRVPADTPKPRIGIHSGEVLYRDGDYYGREVNRAARVVARAAGGEVLVTRVIVNQAQRSDALQFKLIGEIRLKGFAEPTELYSAHAAG